MKNKLFMVAIFAAILSSCSTGVNKYHIDATLGDDNNSGLSPDKAWKTLSRAEGLVLKPGEQLLLKRGEVFDGQLVVCARGVEDSISVVGAYGEGSRPCIVAPDSSMYALKVTNSDYLTVRDIEVINHGSEDLARRTGVYVEVKDYGTSHYVTLDSLYIHDVNGSTVKREGAGSGLYVAYKSDSIPSRYDHLLIQNCHIARCQRNAMIWQEESDRDKWFPSMYTTVRKNLIEEVPGDGIVPIWCDSCLVEYNIMRNCPEVLPMTEAAAGFWPWSCDNTVIQFNEVSDHKAPWDGQAYDCDYNCHNTVIRYNYSHDNYGGLVLVCTPGTEPRKGNVGNIKPVVEYNISINDGLRPNLTRDGMFSPSVHFGGHSTDAMFAHNIIHQNVKPAENIDSRMIVLDQWEGFAENASFIGNVFYTGTQSGFEYTKSVNNTFKDNAYIGKFANAMEQADENDAKTYEELVLSKGADGFAGLSSLMDEVEVCGVKGHFVNPDKIKEFLGKFGK